MMPSSSSKYYSRFIPSEEVGSVTQWKFGAVDGSDLLEPEPELLAQPSEEDEAARLALIQQACDEAYAQGHAQGQAEAGLQWQQRMDEYIANEGQSVAQRLDGLVRSLDSSLADMQQTMAQELLALACDIARQVVRQELTVNPQAIAPVVREAVGMVVAQGRPAVVRLHPSDMDKVDNTLRAELGGSGVQWLADASVPAGGCLVESGGMQVDGALSKRWDRALAALGLQSAWQEVDDAH